MNIITDSADKFVAKTLYGIATKSSVRGRAAEPPRSFYNVDDFPFVQTVLGKKDILINETEQLLDHESDIPSFQKIAQLPDQRRKTQIDDNWKNFVLILNDEKIEENCARCPGIMSVLENDIPGVRLALFGPVTV